MVERRALLAVEPTATPSLTKGVYAFDYGDSARMAPVVKMHTLGHGFVPPSIHAGGLRYHGMAPSLCALYDAGMIEAVAVKQLATFEAAVQFARPRALCRRRSLRMQSAPPLTRPWTRSARVRNA